MVGIREPPSLPLIRHWVWGGQSLLPDLLTEWVGKYPEGALGEWVDHTAKTTMCPFFPDLLAEWVGEVPEGLPSEWVDNGRQWTHQQVS